MTGHEILEDVIEKAAREMYEGGPAYAGTWDEAPDWVTSMHRSWVLAPMRIAWAAAREQALAEAEEALKGVYEDGSGRGNDDWGNDSEVIDGWYVAALRLKEGGE